MTQAAASGNNGVATYAEGNGSSETIASRFHEVAQRFPDRTALVSEAWRPKYAELDAAANGLAREIIAAGGAIGDRAVVFMQHDAPIVAVMLALIKAGRIVVVLNLGDPSSRLQQILEEVDPTLIVADAVHAERSREFATTARRVLEVGIPPLPPLPQANDACVPPDDLAYLIFTSGTAGRPKGVMQTYRNLLHQVHKYTSGCGLRSDDRIALFASLGSGQGMSTAWCALLNGATLYPYPIAVNGVAQLADWIDTHRITYCVWTSSLFRTFISALPNGRRLPHVRVVRLGAETATDTDFEAFSNHFADDCALVHTFSSSETGNVTQFSLTKKDRIATGRLPAGRPADGMEVSIVDELGRSAPPGDIGEIVVRSKYLSPGYWRNDDLTSKHFWADADAERGRCFRGGDLGRLTNDGLLIHMGRKDSAVKVHGNRVELCEVEDAVRALRAVDAAVVIPADNRSGDTELIVYFTRRRGEASSSIEMRRELGERLPAYMIPTALVELDRMPLLPNGKLDRDALRPWGFLVIA